ncbi:MAG: hypothetical protein ACKER6_01060 [Candidatus Hodgkinia cicadicola]
MDQQSALIDRSKIGRSKRCCLLWAGSAEADNAEQMDPTFCPSICDQRPQIVC